MCQRIKSMIFVFCCMFFQNIGIQSCNEEICMTSYKKHNELILIFDVRSLNSEVGFYHDNYEYAYCVVPFPHVDCFTSIKNSKISQDLETNITIFKIKDTNKYYSKGKWICMYEGVNHSVIVDSVSPIEDSKSKDNTLLLAVTITCCITLLGYLSFKIFINRWWKDYKSKKKTSEDEENMDLPNDRTPLLGLTDNKSECCMCKMLSVCAVCHTCQDFYCEVCCNAHTKSQPEHKVCLIDHVVQSRFDIKCKGCKKEPSFVCTTCKNILCSSCKCSNHSQRIRLITSNVNIVERRPSVCSSVPSKTYEIDLPGDDQKNNRVCGLCFLNDETIVVSDINNKKLHIVKKNNQSRGFKFSDEPRGMVHMFENQIAITFAYKEEIHILDITDDDVKDRQVLPLKDIGKPYSIAYNSDHFAVEIGESEDGFIAILDSSGKLAHRIKNRQDEFAYFTGNTIRLALDMTNGRLFIAALSKNTVSCINFEGRTIWKVSIPSPRSIIFLPGVPLENKNLILASKRHATIYQMSSKLGSTEVLIGLTEGPRHMAYNLYKKLLCVQVGNNKLLVYKYEIK